MKKKLILSLVLLAALAAPVQAQLSAGKKGGPPEATPEEIEQKREAAAVDRKYKDTLRRTDSTAAPAKIDPWANMRGNDTSSATKR